jgi:hypothetical protein
MDLKEIGWAVWTGLIWLLDEDQWRAYVITVMNLWGSIKVEEFSSSCATGVSEERADLHGVSYLVGTDCLLSYHVVCLTFLPCDSERWRSDRLSRREPLKAIKISATPQIFLVPSFK